MHKDFSRGFVASLKFSKRKNMRYHTKSSQSQSFFVLHLTSSMPWRNLLYNTLFNFLYKSWSFYFTLVFPTPSIHSLHMSRENKSKKATCQLYWKMLAKVRHWHISTCDFLEYWISNQIRSFFDNLMCNLRSESFFT